MSECKFKVGSLVVCIYAPDRGLTVGDKYIVYKVAQDTEGEWQIWGYFNQLGLLTWYKEDRFELAFAVEPSAVTDEAAIAAEPVLPVKEYAMPYSTAPIALKDSNPKDLIGSTKLSLSVVPDSLPIYAALAFAEGDGKYGGYNYRVAGVRASIYHDAAKRHLSKWWNGQECDPKTKVPHLASVIACMGIILDADLVGKLTDDRPPAADIAGLIERHEEIIKHLKELHKDCKPKHYTEVQCKLDSKV